MHGHSGTSHLFNIWFGVYTVTAKTTFRDDIYSQSIKGSYSSPKFFGLKFERRTKSFFNATKNV